METFGTNIKQKTSNKYWCEICNYITNRKNNLVTHMTTAKHLKELNGTNFKQKISNNYCCEKCNYITHDTNNTDIHMMTAQKQTELNGIEIKHKLSNQYCCEICNRLYATAAGLWKHKQKCKIAYNIEVKEHEGKADEPTDKDLIMMVIKQNTELIKENSDLKTMMVEQSNKMMEQSNKMMEVVKNGTIQNSNNNTINSHNKSFNLHFFLNETCKDAMNITDFVEKIKLRLSDLERVGELGYIEGISNIIVKNLKDLDVTQRPVHCTDKKRETIYIKDEDKWERDEEQNKMHKMIRKITVKNARMLPKFKEVHPDCIKSTSSFSDQYNKITMEAMGGMGENDFEKEERIIKKVSKEVMVEKDLI